VFILKQQSSARNMVTLSHLLHSQRLFWDRSLADVSGLHRRGFVLIVIISLLAGKLLAQYWQINRRRKE